MHRIKEARDSGHAVELWIRRGLMTLFAVLALLALLNVFGQRPVTSTAGGEEASLEVVAPSTLRGGAYFMGRSEVSTAESIEPWPVMSPTPNFESFQPPNENGSRGTGTPTLTPTMPALARSVT